MPTTNTTTTKNCNVMQLTSTLWGRERKFEGVRQEVYLQTHKKCNAKAQMQAKIKKKIDEKEIAWQQIKQAANGNNNNLNDNNIVTEVFYYLYNNNK